MSRAIRIVMTVILACICQTDLCEVHPNRGCSTGYDDGFSGSADGYTGAYGGFCAGSVMALLYDASVGYVLAINLVCYTFIGWAAPMLRHAMNKQLHRVKHKSYFELIVICFFLVLVREGVYIGYLFLIGAEQSIVTILRALLCSAYSAVMILPCSLIQNKIMSVHIIRKKKNEDLVGDSEGAGRKR